MFRLAPDARKIEIQISSLQVHVTVLPTHMDGCLVSFRYSCKIVFVVLRHYLLVYIRIVLVFLFISYIAFVTKLYHYLLYNLSCAT